LVDCGAGIRLFSTIEELASHLELAENETDDDDEEEATLSSEEPETEVKNPCDTDKGNINATTFSPTLSTPGLDSLDGPITATGTLTLTLTPSPKPPPPLRANMKKTQYTFKAGGRFPSARMRAFVAQRYIVRIPPLSNRKWHVRAYALALGRLKVYLFRDMIALLALEPYQPPWENPSLRSSLTNTALQDKEEFVANERMREFWGESKAWEGVFPDRGEKEWKTHVFYQICGVAGEVFRVAVHTMADKFTTVDKCFLLIHSRLSVEWSRIPPLQLRSCRARMLYNRLNSLFLRLASPLVAIV
jgi:hypothetical protein